MLAVMFKGIRLVSAMSIVKYYHPQAVYKKESEVK